ncbi:ALBINO3-like protein 2, chloroplastic isoform X1 [Amaranthus tricolor]|uniref:ALBINO3-like protein 2, chloroplastic isoform X1 n=1 Tax=Amaranthus tricolor TaxID=29722 RepID=UPI002587E04B|nr:ALBINO3-like protein 2, chloroplastic isoform X1 [Amaranthus tricolor]
MATSGIISAYLRRSKLSLLRPTIISLSSSSPLPTTSNSTLPLFSRHTTSFRYFSAQPSDSDFTHQLNSVTESELRSLGYIDGSQVSDAAGTLLDDLHLPIRCVVSLLDGYHDLTGLPWWIVIASSTVAMRITLSPWILLQLHKLRQIGEVFPKLPPPFPPPFSGRSFVNQFSLFWRKRRELGCPSFLWFVASITVQLPCFLLWMTSIRKMSLDQHPGFDTGGILWFQNLTEVSNGPFGLILPVLIAGLHFCNIQVSFRSVSAVQGEETFHLLAKLYKKYLELLTLPILIVGFYIPQGSLVYWVTNSSLSLVQQLCLQHPVISQKLGLVQKSVNVSVNSEGNVNGSTLPDAPRKRGPVSAFDLSPLQLVDQSVAHLSAGRVDRALPLLRVALSKDPEYYIALTVLGQAMLQLKDYDEAVEYLECALSKISLRDPTDAEALDYFIQASMSAGAAYYHQGKLAESFAHFERIRDIEVPEEPTAKARYYEGLMVFSSFLINEGRKDEATHYLRMAAAYDPQYAVYLEHLDKVRDNFVSDLASSRRADY